MRRTLVILIVFFFWFVALALPKRSTAAEPPDPHKAIFDRLDSLTALPLPQWKFHDDVPHPEDPGLNDSDWQTMKVNEPWSSGARVLRQWIEIPEKIRGYATRGARVKLEVAFHSDKSLIVTILSNGSVLARTDEDMQQPVLLTTSAQPGQKFLVAIRVDAEPAQTVLAESRLRIEPPPDRPNPALLRQEFLAVIPMIASYPDGKAEREQQLNAAANAIDLASLDRGDQAAFDASLRSAQTKLEALNPWLKGFTIRVVGNSHIDMAWLWPWTETVEVVRNTFQSVLDLMREYPDFRFTMSSAQTYSWMEEKYPDMFREIEQRIKEGRWEVIGGMWVEPDLNMPDGESLVRQILVGKRYFQSRFGVDVKIGWNPDSFGYNWQLPQIYKKSGMNYFVTQKLLWAHEFTAFPYKLFWWESPDGSRLLTYFPHDYAGGIDAESLGKDFSIWAPSIYGTSANKPEIMHLYGVGDHGGGPTRQMLDNGVRLMAPNVVFPKLVFSSAKAFFDELAPQLPGMNVPVWKDELYFQYHRGVMTTQAETKRRIRRAEENILKAELFSSVAMLEQHPYPQEEFEQAWKRLLFDHFHDIMPGSGIAVNYLDAKRNLEDVDRMSDAITSGALKEISDRIDTQGLGVPVVIFNSLSWRRNEVIEIEAQLPAPAKFVEVVDSSGKPVASQLLSNDRATHRVRLLVLADTPPVGYKTYFVRSAAKAAVANSKLKASGNSLENEFVRLTVDAQSGCMTSLFDKRSKTEALAAAETDTGGPKDRVCGNLLQTFGDKPQRWDAWNIDADFEKQHWDLDKADEVKLIESGPLRAVLRVKNHFQNSSFVRDITLYDGATRVDVRTEADWHEKHILLKVAFPLSAHNDKATFEIPYGSIGRPTTRNTPAEQAEFEVPAMRWADLSDQSHGFSLLNDCKYGYDAKGNVLRLSLLRSPEWPDPHADEGRHEFTYSLYPHGGSWREAQTVRRGYELNFRMATLQAEKHEGALPAEHSFLKLPDGNVVLTAIKKAEDSDSLVVRFYEWAGKETNVRVELPPGAKSASDADLMERPEAQVPIENSVAVVHTKPYEIKTIKVEFGR